MFVRKSREEVANFSSCSLNVSPVHGPHTTRTRFRLASRTSFQLPDKTTTPDSYFRPVRFRYWIYTHFHGLTLIAAHTDEMGDANITTSEWRLVEVGRVVLFNEGQYEGRLAAVVEIIDHKRV